MAEAKVVMQAVE
jgi:chromosome segregation ATPase